MHLQGRGAMREPDWQFVLIAFAVIFGVSFLVMFLAALTGS